MTPIAADDPDLPDVCFHGTLFKHVLSIRSQGFIAGGKHRRSGRGRNHIHFSPYMPGDDRTISGVRYDCECVFVVDWRRAVADGIPFFLSDNKVMLTRGIRGVLPEEYVIDLTPV